MERLPSHFRVLYGIKARELTGLLSGWVGRYPPCHDLAFPLEEEDITNQTEVNEAWLIEWTGKETEKKGESGGKLVYVYMYVLS